MVVTVGCGADVQTDATLEHKHDLSATTPSVPKARAHLTVGERVPEFKCEGWLNGSPPEFGDDVNDIVVVDVWAMW